MLPALLLAAGDMIRPALLGLVGRALLLTLAVLLALQAAAVAAIRAVAPDHLMLPWIGQVALRDWLSWGSLALLPLMGLFLMAPVAGAFCGMMSDAVARRVEAIHYPARRGRDTPFRQGLLEGLAVTLAVIGVTLLTLILTPFLGPLAPVLYYGGNGWLLGREFFQSAATRHMPRDQAAALRRARSGTVTATGVVVALLLTVPVLNILVPVLAMAAFTHLFQITAGSAGPRSRHPRG